MSAIARALIKNADSIFTVGKIASRGLSTINLAGDIGKNLLKNADMLKFTKAIGFTGDTATILKKPISGIVDASKYVDDFVGAIPSSTDDIVTSVVKNSDDVLEAGLDTGGSVLQANTKTISRISNAVDSTTSVSRATFGAASGLSSSVDDVLEAATDLSKTTSKFTTSVDNIADVGGVLKKSKGLSKLDDVVDATTSVGKKVDEVAEAGKKAVKSDLHKFVDKFGGLIQISIITSYTIGSYMSAQSSAAEGGDEDNDPTVWVTDPESTIYTIDSEDDPENVIVGENGDKTTTDLLSDALKNPTSIAAIIAFVIMIIYILLG